MMDNTYRLEDFIDLARTRNAREFEERFSEPFLVLLCGEFDQNDEFSTNVDEGGEENVVPGKVGKRLDPGATVYHLKKRKGANHFSQMIMIGRASNCDLVLKSKEISKLHAYISQKEDPAGGKTYHLADGSSRNGTGLNGEFLPSGKTRSLENGDRIALGPNLVLQFFTAQGFFEKLSEQI